MLKCVSVLPLGYKDERDSLKVPAIPTAASSPHYIRFMTVALLTSKWAIRHYLLHLPIVALIRTQYINNNYLVMMFITYMP